VQLKRADEIGPDWDGAASYGFDAVLNLGMVGVGNDGGEVM
jgi:hypothetical protein